jgi:glycosyltransferase involved in cell wall biosynthesis
MIVRMHGFTAGINAVWKDHVSATMRLQLNWERKELKAADLITVVSEHEASSLRARFGADRVRVVHNSIDSDRWRKLSMDASKGTVDSQDVLFAGSLRWRKGIFVLLRAAHLLRRAGWRGRLVLAGGTSHEFERYLRVRAVFGMELPDWVMHLGVCHRERLSGLYRDAGVCCFPSLREPFGYTCLEAMACGGIIVGSSGTGMAEILTDVSGFLVPPGDVSRLVVALKSALSMNAEERGRMKEAAQQRVHDRFDHGVIIPELLKAYSEAISSYGAVHQ